MELADISNFHRRRPHGGSSSEPFDPELNTSTIRPRIHRFINFRESLPVWCWSLTFYNLSALQNNTLVSNTQNPEISRFQIHRILEKITIMNAYKYKTKRQAKLKQRQNKIGFCWLVTSLPLYLKSTAVLTDHKRVIRKTYAPILGFNTIIFY